MSAFTEKSEWPQGLRKGASGHIAKPFVPEELLSRVQSLLTLSATQQDLRTQTEALQVTLETLAEKELRYQTLADFRGKNDGAGVGEWLARRGPSRRPRPVLEALFGTR